MNRGARLIGPLFFAALLGVLHWIVTNNPGLLRRIRIDDHELAQKISLFLLFIPLIFFVVRGIDTVAFDVLSRRRKVQAPLLLREIVSIGLFILLFVWAVTINFGTGFTAVLATGTVVAAVLGLALQETLGNLFAGIALHLEDSFEVGDVVRSGEHFGVVEAVRWRGTRLRTFVNSIVIVPNAMLARQPVEVFPRNNLNGRVLQVNVDANIAPSLAIPVLAQAAAHVEGVSSQVPVFARVGNFAESFLVYEIKYHTGDYSQRDRIDADIRKAVWYALRRNEIPLGTPMRIFHRYASPSAPREPERNEIVDRLSRIDVLTPLSHEEHESIATAARIHTFSKGETIIRQGQSGSSMFVVHAGTVSVLVDDNEMARLGEGDFFGEMALLTGENRAADVVALTDVIVIEIVKEALRPVLHHGLVESISARVAERRGSIESIRSASNTEAHETVLTRIKHYFGL